MQTYSILWLDEDKERHNNLVLFTDEVEFYMVPTLVERSIEKVKKVMAFMYVEDPNETVAYINPEEPVRLVLREG